MNAQGNQQRAKKITEEEKSGPVRESLLPRDSSLINSRILNQNRPAAVISRLSSASKVQRPSIMEDKAHIPGHREPSRDVQFTSKQVGDKKINVIGEYGKNFYEKMQSQFQDFIKENKDNVKLQGNKRFSGKNGEFFLQKQNNNQLAEPDGDGGEEDSKYTETQSQNSENTTAVNQQNNKGGRFSLYTQRKSKGITEETVEIIHQKESLPSNIANELYKNENPIDRISTFLKDAAIIKELNMQDKVTVTKTKETIVTVNNDLTPLPDIDRKKLRDNVLTKTRFEKAERAAVTMRRMEYALGKNKKIKKISVVQSDHLRIAKIVRIQRWWRSLQFSNKKLIRIQKVYRGFIFRKKFFAELRKLNLMYINFVKMEKIINTTFLKKNFKLIKRYYYLKKILIKVMYIQKHYKKWIKYQKTKRLGAQLQNNLKRLLQRIFIRKFSNLYLLRLRDILIVNLMKKLNQKKLYNLLKSGFDKYKKKVKKLIYYERIIKTALPLIRIHNLNYKRIGLNFLNYLRNKRLREIMLYNLVLAADGSRNIQLRIQSIKWSEIAQRMRILHETSISNKSKALQLWNLFTLKKQKQTLRKRFHYWRNYNKEYFRNKKLRENLLHLVVTNKDKIRDIILRTFTLKFLNAVIKLRNIADRILLQNQKAAKILNLVTLKSQKFSLKRRLDSWRGFNQHCLRNKSKRQMLLRALLANKHQIRNINLRTFILKWLNIALKIKQIQEQKNENKMRGSRLLNFITNKKQKSDLRKRFSAWLSKVQELRYKAFAFRRFVCKYLTKLDANNNKNLLQQKFYWWRTHFLIDKRLMKFLTFTKAMKKYISKQGISMHGKDLLYKLFVIKKLKEKQLCFNVIKNYLFQNDQQNLFTLLRLRFGRWKKASHFFNARDLKARLMFILKGKSLEKHWKNDMRSSLRNWSLKSQKLRLMRINKGVIKLQYFLFYGLSNLNYMLLENQPEVNEKLINQLVPISEKFAKNHKSINKNDPETEIGNSIITDTANQNSVENAQEPSSTGIYNDRAINPIKAEYFTFFKENDEKKLISKINSILNKNEALKNCISLNNSQPLATETEKMICNENPSLSEKSLEKANDVLFIPYSKDNNGRNTLCNFVFSKLPECSQSQYDILNQFANDNKKLNFVLHVYLNILFSLSEKQKKYILNKYISLICNDQKFLCGNIFKRWRKKAELIGINEHNLNTYSLIVVKIFRNRYKKLLKCAFEKWKANKNLVKNFQFQRNQKFLSKLSKQMQAFAVRNHLIPVYQQRFLQSSFVVFLKNLSNKYNKKLRETFNIWKIKILKLEKIGLLKFLSSKMILDRSDYLGKLQMKKYFDLFRSRVLKLKKLESNMGKIFLNYKRRNFEFLKFQILLKETARSRLCKVFSYLNRLSSADTQKKYFVRWLKYTYKDKMNLALIVNLRNRFYKLNKIRNSPDYLLDKYYNLWIDNSFLRQKFNKNVLLKFSSAIKITNLIRGAKHKFELLKQRRIKAFFLTKLAKLEHFKYFSVLKYFHLWRSGIKNRKIEESCDIIASFIENKFFEKKRLAFDKIKDLINKMLIKIAKSDFRFLKIITNFNKEYDFFNPSKQLNAVKFLKKSQTNALFQNFDKTFETTKYRILNHSENQAFANLNDNNNKLLMQSIKNQFSNIVFYNGRAVSKTDYFKFKTNLLGGKKRRNFYNQQIAKSEIPVDKNVPIIFESDIQNNHNFNINSALSKVTEEKTSCAIPCQAKDMHSVIKNISHAHIVVTNQNEIILKKHNFFANKNHILTKRMSHVLQYFILRKELILSDMKKKYYFKKWVFSKKDWLARLIRIQRNVLKFIHLMKALKLQENRALLNFVVKKYFWKKVNTKKNTLYHYYRKLMNWMVLQGQNRYASTLQEYFRKVNLRALALKKNYLLKLKVLFKKYRMVNNIIRPLKLLKALLILTRAQKKIAHKIFKSEILDTTRGRLIAKKYAQLLTLTHAEQLSNRKKALFKDWKNYTKIFRFRQQKAFGNLKHAVDLSLQDKLLEQRDMIIQRLVYQNHFKFVWKIKKYFSLWQNKNTSFKILLFVNFLQRFGYLTMQKHLRTKAVAGKYLKIRHRLLHKQNLLRTKLLKAAGNTYKLKKLFQNKLKFLIADKNKKDKSILKSFILKWMRNMKKYAMLLSVVLIQKKLTSFLLNRRNAKIMNFVRCFNLITMKNIRIAKKNAFEGFLLHVNQNTLYENLHYFCLRLEFLFKEKSLGKIIDYSHDMIIVNYLKKLASKKCLAEIHKVAKKFAHFEKINYLLEVTFYHKDLAKKKFLKILLRGWRFIAVAEASIRKKLKFFQDNIQSLHDELVDRMLDRDNVSLPKDIFYEKLASKKPVSKANVGKFNELIAKKNKQALIRDINRINDYNSNSNKTKNVNFSMVQNNPLINDDLDFDDEIFNENKNNINYSMATCKNPYFADTNRNYSDINYTNKADKMLIFEDDTHSDNENPNGIILNKNSYMNTFRKNSKMLFKVASNNPNTAYKSKREVNNMNNSLSIKSLSDKLESENYKNSGLGSRTNLNNSLRMNNDKPNFLRNKGVEFEISRIERIHNDSQPHDDQFFNNPNNTHVNNIFNFDM